MRVLVTGGTGYVGREVVAQLREENHQVRALVRSTASVPDDVDAVTGDVTDPASLTPAAEGVDAFVDKRRPDFTSAKQA